MAPKHHPTPLSGGDRKALNKELGKARVMTGILAAQSAEMRAKAETMLQQADIRSEPTAVGWSSLRRSWSMSCRGSRWTSTVSTTEFSDAAVCRRS
jgi:hypothetical protein